MIMVVFTYQFIYCDKDNVCNYVRYNFQKIKGNYDLVYFRVIIKLNKLNVYHSIHSEAVKLLNFSLLQIYFCFPYNCIAIWQNIIAASCFLDKKIDHLVI